MCHKEAELFRVLGVESRIRILELLKQRGPLGSNEMAQILGVTPSAVSQHLKILKSVGLVRNQRKGFWIPYQVDEKALEQCGTVISSVCRCGCDSGCETADQSVQEGTSSDEEELEYLKNLERELEEELRKVRIRMNRVEKRE